MVAEEQYGFAIERQTVDGEEIVRVRGVDGKDLVMTSQEFDEVVEHATDAASFKEGLIEYEADSEAEWREEAASARSETDEMARETMQNATTGEAHQESERQ